MRSLGIISAALLASCIASAAQDQRCKVPPYGGTDAEFHSFVKYFGALVVPTKVLPAICRAKFEHGPRTGLYNLGFTDEQIARESTEQLAVDMIDALKNLADRTP